MTEPVQDYLRVSYSSLNLADTCLRKFEFNKLYPRRVRQDDQFAADVGTALHAGLQNYMHTGSEDAAYWALMQKYPYIWEFGQARDDRSLEAAMSTLEEMMWKMDMSEWELMTIIDPQGNEVPAIEVPFELRLKGITLPDGRGVAFTGFMDAAMRHKSHGLVRTLDIKTHRRQREDATPVYKFDTQQVPYGICLEHIQGNVVEEFEVLYLDCYVDLVSPRVHMYPFPKDSTDIQEWLVNTVLRVQRIQRAMEMDYFPRTDGGCLSWNRPCYFLDVCQSRDRDSIEQWLLMGEKQQSARLTSRGLSPTLTCLVGVSHDQSTQRACQLLAGLRDGSVQRHLPLGVLESCAVTQNNTISLHSDLQFKMFRDAMNTLRENRLQLSDYDSKLLQTMEDALDMFGRDTNPSRKQFNHIRQVAMELEMGRY